MTTATWASAHDADGKLRNHAGGTHIETNCITGNADDPEAHKRESRSDRDPMHAPSWPTTFTNWRTTKLHPFRHVAWQPAADQGELIHGHDWHIFSVPRVSMARSRTAALQAICGYVPVAQQPPFFRNLSAPFMFCPFYPSWNDARDLERPLPGVRFHGGLGHRRRRLNGWLPMQRSTRS